ncbi:helix-turn-helix domain-containing protein [Actinoplanes regularis]|uniref:helix-turn-helix domain-containing protein n=1 Tax=Actinoplanes regularis TaxID=52697 RepID=UPI0024A55083|nr:helix-turn-helix transcriptional regulator [Actinoplanes regularis]GLW35238.1 transcriptional regulator [Actinoplanes regularis]
MISTYVRRLRLAAELTALRQLRKLSSDQLARTAGLPRTTVSRLENGRMRPDPDDVMRILQALDIVDGDHWLQIMTIAREAGERGWWESWANEMGIRQALYANLEAGAASIREYQMTFLPGLLQTSAFSEQRAQVDKADWSSRFDPARAVEARERRQRMLHRPDGPAYEVVIDQLAVRRPAVTLDVLHVQLAHIADLAARDRRIAVKVLPIDARIEGLSVPRSGFSIYTYPDPGDPIVVAVDTVTDDLVLTKPDAVGHYLELYTRLNNAALTAPDSVRFLKDIAEETGRLTSTGTAA